MSTELERFYQLTRDFIPDDEKAAYDKYLQNEAPGLYKKLKNKERVYTEDLNSSLKWAVRNNKLGVIDTYLYDGKFTPKDVCIMSAQNNKSDIVDMCLEQGVRPTKQLFNAACLSGNVELAQRIEKILCKTDYDPEATYPNIDYCTALYGAIAKSRVEIIKWLMLKSIAPDYQVIAWILPRVKSQEVIDLVVSATPEINRDTVMYVVNSLSGDTLESLKNLVLFRDEDAAVKVFQKNIINWINSSEQFKFQILRLVLLQGFTKLLSHLVEKININKFANLYVLDCLNKETLAIVLNNADVSRQNIISAAVKVGDFELAAKHGWRSDHESVLRGAVLGNRLTLVREILESESINNRLRTKLIGYAKNLKLSAMEQLLSEL